MDNFVEALNNIFPSPIWTVLIIAMFPLIELKGAIPVGLKCGLPLLKIAGLAYIGSTLISIAVFFLLIPIFKLLKKIAFVRRIVVKIESVFSQKADKLAERSNKNARPDVLKFWLLLLFVAVPFPVTGVWTGTAIAVFLDMKFFQSFKAVALGNFIAGSLITLLTFLFSDYVNIILYALFAAALIMLVIFIVKVAKSKTV